MQLGRKITDDRAAAWLREMRRSLRQDETPVALLKTAASKPTLDLLLVTSQRVTGWASPNIGSGPKVAIAWHEVVDYRLVGMLEKFAVRRTAGDEVFLGMVHKDDRPLLDNAFASYCGTPADVSSNPVRAGQPVDHGFSASTNETVGEPSADADWLDKLARLGDMHERGLLDAREFRLAKQKLLRPSAQ